jgi:hypothetical protein
MRTRKTLRVPVDAATIRRIAVAASVDPRTVIRHLSGEHVRGMPRHRIAHALKARGLEVPPRDREAA